MSERDVLLVSDAVKEFAKFLIDKEPNVGIIYKMDIPDFVIEFLDKADV